MRKFIALLAFTGFFLGAQAQVQGGTLVESGRKLVGAADFKVTGQSEGIVVIELAVNRTGNVTGAKVIYDETTIKSTPQVMKAQNSSKKLKFTPGTHYAEFELVRVKYTYVKG